ncbi:MAG: hypothetical protein H6Q13_3434 [Bacteroidetes bacterium]|nr:hypothetical protein [Bacteroidota bacterium]
MRRTTKKNSAALTTRGTIKKTDLSQNGDKLSLVIDDQKKREEKLFPLQINKKTVIYVEEDKLNTFYAEKARKKLKLETDE